MKQNNRQYRQFPIYVINMYHNPLCITDFAYVRSPQSSQPVTSAYNNML